MSNKIDEMKAVREYDKNQVRRMIKFAINYHNAERGSDTDDDTLSRYLMDCLAAYEKFATGLTGNAWNTDLKKITFMDEVSKAAYRAFGRREERMTRP